MISRHLLIYAVVNAIFATSVYAADCRPDLHRKSHSYLGEVFGGPNLIPFGIQIMKRWAQTIFSEIKEYSGKTFHLEIPFELGNFTRGIWSHQQFFALEEFSPSEIKIWNHLDRLSGFGKHEEGAWVIRTHAKRLFVGKVKRHSDTPLNEMSNELPSLNALLSKHRLKLKDVESVSFFHRHPGSEILLSPDDICLVDDLAQAVVTLNPELSVHIFALAALGDRKVVSHYGRKASSPNSIVFAPYLAIEKARSEGL